MGTATKVRTDLDMRGRTIVGVADVVKSDGTSFAGSGAGVASVNTRTGAVVITKTDVGLANVDNTSDATKKAATLATPTFTAPANVLATGASHTVDDVITLLQALGLCKQS